MQRIATSLGRCHELLPVGVLASGGAIPAPQIPEKDPLK